MQSCEEQKKNMSLLAMQLQTADAILLGAGAGLSAAAGISFADEKLFRERFPYWAARGLHNEYQMFSFRNWTEGQRWAYMISHIQRVRWEFPPAPLYQTLKALLHNKNYMILTSNVDRQFLRNGFPEDRLFEYQGSYDLLSCSAECCTEVWPLEPLLPKLLSSINVANFSIPPSTIPRCPHCGAPLEFAFRNYPNYTAEKERYHRWLRQTESQGLCIIEIGVGFNSPGVIRVPFERITGERERVRMFRITTDYPDSEEEIAYPEIPRPIADKAYSINADAAFVIETLATLLSI